MQKYNRHHKLAKVNGGKKYVNGHTNIVRVPVETHRAFHYLFGTLSAQDICAIINTWIDPNWKFICVKRERGNCHGRQKNSNNRKDDNHGAC